MPVMEVFVAVLVAREVALRDGEGSVSERSCAEVANAKNPKHSRQPITSRAASVASWHIKTRQAGGRA